jgi:hypothetical protein
VCPEICASLFNHSGEACSNYIGSGSCYGTGSNARVDCAGFCTTVGSGKCAQYFERSRCA